MLDALAHLERVVDDLLRGNELHADAARADQDHKVETRDECGSVLHLLVQLFSVDAAREDLAEVDLHVHELLANGGPCLLRTLRIGKAPRRERI